jgi:hypothetical protein
MKAVASSVYAAWSSFLSLAILGRPPSGDWLIRDTGMQYSRNFGRGAEVGKEQ